MSITVEEMNLISIYHEDTRAGQLARLRAVRPLYLGDPELVGLLRGATNNLNQIARRANETRSVYAADVEDMQARYAELWEAANKILLELAQIS